MNRRTLNSSRGFTLVELLVVISIIGVLMSLTLPAINSAREAARRAVCVNNIRQVGLAMRDYDANKKKFPGYAGNPTRNTSVTTVSWQIALLPNLGATGDYKNWEENNQALSVFGYREIFVCPSDPPDRPTTPQTSYVINAGIDSADVRAAGLSFSNPSTTFNSVARGKTMTDADIQTLMLSENLNAGNYTDTAKWLVGMVWYNAVPSASSNPEHLVNGRWTTPVWTIGSANIPATDNHKARPSSFHPGGVNVVFVDGSTRFMREDIDYTIYRTLMTSSGSDPSLSSYSTVAEVKNLNEGDYVNQ
jgi:prepilin-type N-terminal cleavage/methylation domain-containing protein/prepilin-type processing-associated H-X9-DG protein